MSIAEKLTAIAENEPKVFEAGKDAQWNEFWDAYQLNGERTNYQYAFAGTGWSPEIFRPKYPVVPTSNAAYCFAYWTYNAFSGYVDLVEHCKRYGITIDFSQATNTRELFRYATRLTAIPEVNVSNSTSTTYLFGNCNNLTKIEKLILSDSGEQDLSNAFSSCGKLVDIVIEGVIGTNGLNMSACPLSHDSLLSVINALKDYAGDTSTHTCTLGATNLAKLTDAEKAIATEKGWSLV